MERSGNFYKAIQLGYILISILIGCMAYNSLYEWQEIEALELGNKKIDELRKEINNINIQMIKFSLLGETILEWNDKDIEHYHARRMAMDSMLCRFKATYPAERIDSVRSLLEDKERQMFQIVRLMDEQQSINKKIANSFLLLLFNNLTAWLFTSLGVWLGDENSFFPQGLYITSVIATFVSFLYTNARYLESFILVEKQKKELEINLLREKEHAAQMQFEVLKAQINPHFMFNNFNVLSELIMEDPLLADKFLENLSNVYRYVIQNLKHDIVDLRDEIKLLYSYIYLIKIRYEDAIHIDIDETLEQTDGQIPPMSLQLLVENAIKHNQFSADHPLSIHIFHEERYIVVENELRPLASELASTGIGHHNLTERYFLLCRATPVIEKREDTYIVKLPIIHDIHHEHIDYRR